MSSKDKLITQTLVTSDLSCRFRLLSNCWWSPRCCLLVLCLVVDWLVCVKSAQVRCALALQAKSSRHSNASMNQHIARAIVMNCIRTFMWYVDVRSHIFRIRWWNRTSLEMNHSFQDRRRLETHVISRPVSWNEIHFKIRVLKWNLFQCRRLGIQLISRPGSCNELYFESVVLK